MYGDIIRISDNLLMVEGQEPSSILLQPDKANSIVYKPGSNLYIMDTGGTPFFRDRILKAVAQLRPFDSVILLNSHGHVDHTANNSIINDIDAKTKKHYISERGLESLNYLDYFSKNFNAVGTYYNIEDGPRFPASLLFKPIKLFRMLSPHLIQSRILPFIIGNILKKFKPLEPSKETAAPFESLPLGKLSVQGIVLEGWNLCDDIFAIPSRGHSPDSVSFYIPKEKFLYLADEMFPYFNCWIDSSSAHIIKILNTSLALYRNGDIAGLVGGHQQKLYTDIEIERVLTELIEDYAIFKAEIMGVLQEHKEGVTVVQIYNELEEKRTRIPTLDKYFRMEFPKMPPLLKTNITSVLLEEKIQFSGPDGKKKFGSVRRLPNGALKEPKQMAASLIH
jgi:glyoxylase-like metal-dependent hydrolase (beta-lactamase superfamily II)